VSKDYKRPEPAARGGSQLLVGILIGLVLGLAIALGVAWYINKMPNPFLTRTPPAKLEPAQETSAPARIEGKTARAPDAKPRFDFYKILPGAEETITDPQAKGAQQQSTTAARETFFLQAGAFQNAPDADSLRARLALLGIEARVQTATLPEKGVWHRVRIGPYTSVEELGRTRETLKQNGVETTLIKVRE
jgi:cell division protein FtsN